MLKKRPQGLLALCEELLTPLSIEIEGELKGGFCSITGSTMAADITAGNVGCRNSLCINDGCLNYGCVNISCTNSKNGCRNISILSTPKPKSTTTVAPNGTYVSCGFLW